MSFDLAALREGIDFRRLADDFKGLDPQDPGMWPTAPRVLVAVLMLILTVA